MISMRKCLSSLFLIVSMLFFVGCDVSDFQLETDKTADNSIVTPIEELVETNYFHQGALEHILKGELNRKNQAVGFHYEGMPETNGAVIEGSASTIDDQGIYEAKVTVKDIEKTSNQGKSTFFPKEWDSQDVVDAINEAYENKTFITGNTYEGLTEEGITVRMYLDNQDKIISAFPQYEGG